MKPLVLLFLIGLPSSYVHSFSYTDLMHVDFDLNSKFAKIKSELNNDSSGFAKIGIDDLLDKVADFLETSVGTFRNSEERNQNNLWTNDSCLVDSLYFIQQLRAKRRWSFQGALLE